MLFVIGQQAGESHLGEHLCQPLVAGIGRGQPEVAAQGIGKQVHPLAHHGQEARSALFAVTGERLAIKQDLAGLRRPPRVSSPIRVDLPQPVCPSSASLSPACGCRVQPCSTGASCSG